jgi:hypothetical protein
MFPAAAAFGDRNAHACGVGLQMFFGGGGGRRETMAAGLGQNRRKAAASTFQSGRDTKTGNKILIIVKPLAPPTRARGFNLLTP